MTVYAITLTKLVPGEPTGQLSMLLDDLASDIKDAEQIFNKTALKPPYVRKELWSKDTISKIMRLVKEEKYIEP